MDWFIWLFDWLFHSLIFDRFINSLMSRENGRNELRSLIYQLVMVAIGLPLGHVPFSQEFPILFWKMNKSIYKLPNWNYLKQVSVHTWGGGGHKTGREHTQFLVSGDLLICSVKVLLYCSLLYTYVHFFSFPSVMFGHVYLVLTKIFTTNSVSVICLFLSFILLPLSHFTLSQTYVHVTMYYAINVGKADRWQTIDTIMFKLSK